MQIDSGNGLVEKDGLPSDAEYLQSGAEFQLRGEFAGHTSQEVQMISSIPLRLKSNPLKKALLIVPDVKGEEINRIYHARGWSYGWESLISDSTAYLLFVRATSPQIVAPLDWITCHKLYCGTPEAAPLAGQGSAESANTAEKKVETPTQVVLVDWLQFIFQAVHDKHPHALRPWVGVVVTAWDCVAIDFPGGPSEWIKENMPLLHQFCATNHDLFEFSFFGTSVFSGDPDHDPEFKEEISQKDPRKLGYVRHSSDNQESDDFTIPIAWALEWQLAL